MSKEVWLDVVGYEGLYQVSNLGRVKSLKRTVKLRHNSTRLVNERILKQVKAAGRYGFYYYKVNLSREHRVKTRTVHLLMAEAFMNHKSSRSIVVDHKDGNSLNNTLDNLQIITHRENCKKDKTKV